MSKTIKIPEGFGNPVSVMLNGKKYTYTAGSTETVPDEVAALFERNGDNAVIYGRAARVSDETIAAAKAEILAAVETMISDAIATAKEEILEAVEQMIPDDTGADSDSGSGSGGGE